MTESTQADIAKSSKSGRVGRLINLCLVALFFTLVFSMFKNAWNELQSAEKERVSTVSSSLPRVLEMASYREPGFKGVDPDVIWTGKGATLLSGQYKPPESVGFIPRKTRHTWEILAKTPAGSFFVVGFALREDGACDLGSLKGCLDQTGFTPFTKEALKSYIFRELKDPALYRKLFNEDMPKTEVSA